MDGEAAIRPSGQPHAAPGGVGGDRPRREVGSVVGTRSHLQHGHRTGPTGASRASARGVCRFRRSIARSAARRSLTPATCRQGRGGLRARTAPTRGTNGRWRSSCRQDWRARHAAAPASSARCDILDVWFDSGSSHEAVLLGAAGTDVAVRPVPRRQRPASRLVPEFAAPRPWHSRAAAVSRGAHTRLSHRYRRPEDVEVGGQRRSRRRTSSSKAAPTSFASGSR